MRERVVISSIFLFTGFLSASAQEPAKPEGVPVHSHPVCRYCPNPDYPLEARKAKIGSAWVTLEITVTEKGDADPTDIRVIKDPGSGFADEAIIAIKKWKFKPATLKNGKPVKTRIKVEVAFRDTN